MELNQPKPLSKTQAINQKSNRTNFKLNTYVQLPQSILIAIKLEICQPMRIKVSGQQLYASSGKGKQAGAGLWQAQVGLFNIAVILSVSPFTLQKSGCTPVQYALGQWQYARPGKTTSYKKINKKLSFPQLGDIKPTHIFAFEVYVFYPTCLLCLY